MSVTILTVCRLTIREMWALTAARQLTELKSNVAQAEVCLRSQFQNTRHLCSSSVIENVNEIVAQTQGKSRVLEGKLKDQRLAYDTLRVERGRAGYHSLSELLINSSA